MKKLILAALLSATVTAAHAEEHICESFGKLAETIMKARQSDMPLNKMMSAIPKMNESIQPIARTMILEAYDGPKYSSSEYQQRAMASFRNDAELACYKGME